MRFVFPLGAGLVVYREGRKMKKRYIHLGSNSENIKEIQKVGSERTKGDAGCERMVFAVNSNPFPMKFNPNLYKWFWEQGKMTINL